MNGLSSLNFIFGSQRSGIKRMTGIASVLYVAILFALLFYFRPPKADSIFGYAHEIPITVAGLLLFFTGFFEWRKKLIIDNTPTSKIRSAAMGLSEFTGKAGRWHPLKTPLTGADCVYYRFMVEEAVRTSRGRKQWRVINEGCSGIYFYVEDETGRILVDPVRAETSLKRDYYCTDITGTAQYTLGEFRYSEWYVSPGDVVYVLGTVRQLKDTVEEHREKLIQRLRDVKEDADKLKRFDTDGDGNISADEWDKARKQIEDELTAGEMDNSPEDVLIVGQGEAETTFLISDASEAELERKFGFNGGFYIAAGFILVVIMTVSSISRAGLLPGRFTIPWQDFYRNIPF
jgi:hypothetical protein